MGGIKMRGDTTENHQGERKKKRKPGYYIYAIAILVLTIVNITLGAFLLTYVQNIQVSGTVNSNKSEIVSWVKEDPLTKNSIYAVWKYKTGHYELPIYLESVEVRMKAPWKLQVNVKEKQVVGCIREGNAYVYFDTDGLVMRKTTFRDKGIPVVEGIEAKNTGQFEYLKADNEKIFSYIVTLTKEVQEKKLKPERIVWDEDTMKLYFGTVCVNLGKTNYAEKLSDLPAQLELLKGKNGILHLEHYTMGSTVSFEENME